MKIYSLKRFIIAILVLGAVSSCEDFLDRPAEDTYTIDSFYQNDEQLYQSVNTIYNSPWYDFQRGFMKIGDVMAGNLVFDIGDGYTNLVLNNSDADIANASASLWSVNAYCNGVIQNVDLKSGPQVSQKAKNTVKGEAMVWKAMSYFYLVRCFGAVPIIHDNAAIIADNSSATLKRNKIEDVYKYITLILNDAIELLDEKTVDFAYEGEMTLDVALDPELRQRIFPNARFAEPANVLVFANADAASTARNILKMCASGLEVGPILMGMGNKAHIVTPAITARGLLNIAALAGTPVQHYG